MTAPPAASCGSSTPPTGPVPVRVRDILPGPGSGVLAESLFALPTEQVLLFAANDGVGGTELWRSDGTEAGTFVLHDIAPWQLGSDPAALHPLRNSLAFSANDGRRGREPWLMPLSLLTNSTPPSITCPVAPPSRPSRPWARGSTSRRRRPTTTPRFRPPSPTAGPGGFFPFG